MLNLKTLSFIFCDASTIEVPLKLRGTFLEAFYSPDAHICLKLIVYFEKKRENRSQQDRVPYLVTIE